MKVLTFMNQKGGAGKTTSAVAFASILAIDNKVLLIDLDPQGNATRHCDIDKSKLKVTTKDFFLNSSVSTVECVTPTGKNFDLIGSNLDCADIDISLSSQFNSVDIIKSRLEDVEYDYVVIDCPPSITLTTLNALVAANLALIPVEPETFGVDGMSALYSAINKVKIINKRIKHKFFLTQVDNRIKIFKEISEKIRTAVGDDLLETQIRVDSQIREAQYKGQTLVELNSSKAKSDYITLVGEVEQCLSLML